MSGANNTVQYTKEVLDKMVVKYNGGMSLLELALEIRSTPETVKAHLVRAGVTIRARGRQRKKSTHRVMSR